MAQQNVDSERERESVCVCVWGGGGGGGGGRDTPSLVAGGCPPASVLCPWFPASGTGNQTQPVTAVPPAGSQGRGHYDDSQKVRGEGTTMIVRKSGERVLQ